MFSFFSNIFWDFINHSKSFSVRVSRTVISALTERETVMTSGETLGLKHGEGKVPLIFSILTLRVKGEKSFRMKAYTC